MAFVDERYGGQDANEAGALDGRGIPPGVGLEALLGAAPDFAISAEWHTATHGQCPAQTGLARPDTAR